MGLFDKRIEYKPFEYPEYYTEGWLKQSQAHWLHTEISMQKDIKEWHEVLNSKEKHIVENILLAFAQTEVAIEDYWANMVCKWFPKHEIIEMARAFSYSETIHSSAYSYLNESLGLDNFKGFLREPTMSQRFDLLINTKADYDHLQLKQSHNARCDIARSIAIFSAFGEGVALYSSFAILYSFSLKGLLQGVAQQMKYSIRDEMLHSTMGCKLFRHLCQEYPEIKDNVKDKVLEAGELIINLEHAFIDKLFEQGDLDNLKADDLKHFIIKRVNNKIVELGYENKTYFEYDNNKANELSWFYTLSAGVAHADFFALRPTDYSKAGESQDWEDLF